jgi:putative peptide zinc metalloprotease protein
MFRAAEFVADGPELTGRRARAVTVAAIALGVIGFAIFALPLPYLTRATGVVWLPESAMVRPGIDGFVEALLVRDGDAVQAGTPIVALGNEQLAVELERVESLLTKHEVERLASFGVDAMRAGLAEDELARLSAERDRLQQKIELLTVRSATAGRVALHQPHDLLGKYLTQGQLVAHVLTTEPPLVRVLVRNEDVSLVRAQPGAIDVTTALDPGTAYQATLEREIPQASLALPTAALGEAGGGVIPVDPTDQSGRTAREARFQFDLRLTRAAEAHIGARVLVTFRHGDATPAQQLAVLLRRIFLRHFER